jgi:hypothetical protein
MFLYYSPEQDKYNKMQPYNFFLKFKHPYIYFRFVNRKLNTIIPFKSKLFLQKHSTEFLYEVGFKTGLQVGP